MMNTYMLPAKMHQEKNKRQKEREMRENKKKLVGRQMKKQTSSIQSTTLNVNSINK